jgi:hypothetical protein
MPRAEPPYVEVGHAIIADFEVLPNQLGAFTAWNGVQENSAR